MARVFKVTDLTKVVEEEPRNGVPRMKGLISSSFISKTIKPTRFLNVVSSFYVDLVTPLLFSFCERDRIYVLGDGEFSLFPYQYFLRGSASSLTVVEGEVLNDFPRFVSILIAEFAAGGTSSESTSFKKSLRCWFGSLDRSLWNEHPFYTNQMVSDRRGRKPILQNPNLEQLLGVMKCKVGTLMENAISLIGRSENVCGMLSNMMHQLPSEPSRQEAFEDLVMNFILDQEEKVRQLKEYLCVIGSDFMQLSLEVVGKLREEIRIKENRTKKIKKITRSRRDYRNPMEVEPLGETQLEDLGLNTCNHDLPLNSREVPSFDEPEPQPQPLSNCPPLDVSLRNERGLKPPIKQHSPNSFKMKVLDNLTIHTPPSPHTSSFHPKDMYCNYHPCLDDPKRHYRFKPGLLGQSRFLGVDFSNSKVIEGNFLGKGFSLPIGPNEVEKVGIKETHHLEHIIQQLIFSM
nr:hypothetical protein [Tanacetum cinerariifolium]